MSQLLLRPISATMTEAETRRGRIDWRHASKVGGLSGKLEAGDIMVS
jgi:hypothetical protein